jgi:hypothetical protein
MDNINAKEVKNFLSNNEVDIFLQLAKNSSESDWGKGGDGFWDGRVLYPEIFKQNKEILDMFKNVGERIKKTIEELYLLEHEIYHDTIHIVRWFDGMEQPPHADAENADGSHHPLEWRDFGAIIYLNDDYSGGHTYYPNHNFEIIPEPGKLAIHPSDLNHLHGVSKISGGIRYTLPSFWTKENYRAYKF